MKTLSILYRWPFPLHQHFQERQLQRRIIKSYDHEFMHHLWSCVLRMICAMILSADMYLGQLWLASPPTNHSRVPGSQTQPCSSRYYTRVRWGIFQTVATVLAAWPGFILTRFVGLGRDRFPEFLPTVGLRLGNGLWVMISVKCHLVNSSWALSGGSFHAECSS